LLVSVRPLFRGLGRKELLDGNMNDRVFAQEMLDGNMKGRVLAQAVHSNSNLDKDTHAPLFCTVVPLLG
jgi:hypothetical protein